MYNNNIEKECHYVEFMKGNESLCGIKIEIKNHTGKGFKEIYGYELTFDKNEVTCKKCKKILKQK